MVCDRLLRDSDLEWLTMCDTEENRTQILALARSGMAGGTKEETLLWICRRELSNRSLPENMKKYLIGTVCQNEVIRNKRLFGKKGRNNLVTTTRQRCAEEFHISTASVSRYSDFAFAVDRILNKERKFAEDLLYGRVPVSIECFCSGKPDDRKKVAKLMAETRRKERLAQQAEEHFKIKDVPEHDPDAELKVLTFTVPTWTDGIMRAMEATDMQQTTGAARQNLRIELYRLKKSTKMMIRKMNEVDNGRLK